MAKLNAREVNCIKAIIEGGAAESLYNRLVWDTPKTVRLSQYERDILDFHLEENDYLEDADRTTIKKLPGR